MNRNRRPNASFIAGTIAGAVIGAGLALLLTPKTGRQQQEELKARARQAMRRTDNRLDEIEAELEGHIATLKAAAQDLQGEAYEESQRLITKAEILKNDLEDSASRLAQTGRVTKQNVASDAKRLVSEGQEVLTELERMTKKIIKSARSRGNGEDGLSDRDGEED